MTFQGYHSYNPTGASQDFPGSPAALAILGCGATIIGNAGLSNAYSSPAIEERMFFEFWHALLEGPHRSHFFQLPGIFIAVVNAESTRFVRGARFDHLLSFRNPIHASKLELWVFQTSAPWVQAAWRKRLAASSGPLPNWKDFIPAEAGPYAAAYHARKASTPIVQAPLYF